MASAADLPKLPERSVRILEGSPRGTQDIEGARLQRAPYRPGRSSFSGIRPFILGESKAAEPPQSTPSNPSGRPLSQTNPYAAASSATNASPGGAGPLDKATKPLPQRPQPSSSDDVFVDAPESSTAKPKAPDPAIQKAAATTDDTGGLMRQRAPQAQSSSRETTPGRYAAVDQSPWRPQPMQSPLHKRWESCDSTDQLLEHEGTPSKTKARRNGTSFYIVREKRSSDGGGPPDEVMRLPFTQWMKGSVRGHFVACLSEFVGTFMFLWFAFAGTNVASTGAKKSEASSADLANVGSSPIVQLYIAFAFGFSLLVNVWIFYRISGGLFNPAVTLALVLIKAIDWVRGILLFAAQITGAILAAFLAKVMFPARTDVRTTLSDGTSVAQGVFIETLLTAQLVFTILMLAVEKHRATFLAPVGVGFALFSIEICGVFWTGGSVNPARSFGPCVVVGKFESYHWIYWVGPSCGALIACAFYRINKVLDYQMANPGQDEEGSAPPKRVESYV